MMTIQYRLYVSNNGTQFYPEDGSDDLAQLEILQEIYASDDGFLDADGATVVPVVYRFPFGNTLADLENYGSWNPFEA